MSITSSEITVPELQEGEVLVHVNEFALTANNITYAAIGEQLQYWNFFPAEIEGRGIVPVWGYATIVASRNEDIKEGQRLYGYLPMAQYFIALPGKITPYGFRDLAEHRQKNAVIYNNYDFVSEKEIDHPGGKYIPLIRPLFTTSFLLYHFFTDAFYMDAEQIVLTSASSKTALALAAMLKNNATPEDLKVIALTSAANVSFVEETDLYNEVIAYDDYEQIPVKGTTIADFAGNKDLLKKIDDYLDHNLKYIAGIGLTDWESNASSTRLSKAKMFFAPSYAEIKLKEWGPAKGINMIKTSMLQFIKEAVNWIEIDQVDGLAKGLESYEQMASGKVDPKKGIIIKVS